MNQNDKDVEAARKYIDSKMYPIWVSDAFLAGIHYERERQSEVEELAIDALKYIANPNKYCEGYCKCEQHTAYVALKKIAQGMKDAGEK